MHRTRRLTASAALAAIGFAACTTTYTDADLAEQEIREEDAARPEERRDREIGELGGENHEAIEEDIHQIDEVD